MFVKVSESELNYSCALQFSQNGIDKKVYSNGDNLKFVYTAKTLDHSTIELIFWDNGDNSTLLKVDNMQYWHVPLAWGQRIINLSQDSVRLEIENIINRLG